MTEQQGQTVQAAATETAKKKRPQDPEMVAMNKIRSVLADLSPDARYRVLDYVRARVQAESFAGAKCTGVAVERQGLRAATEPASSF